MHVALVAPHNCEATRRSLDEHGLLDASTRAFKHGCDIALPLSQIAISQLALAEICGDSDEDGDEEGQPVSAPGAETSPRSVSTPSPPSLEHFKGGFKLPKTESPEEKR